MKWLKLWWRTFDVKTWLILWFKSTNSVRKLRQRLFLILGIIHICFFAQNIGFYEMIILYIFVWEFSGPQIDKYRDDLSYEELEKIYEQTHEYENR